MKKKELLAQTKPATLFALRIELMSNRMLTYAIEPGVREWLGRWLTEGPCDEMPEEDCFLCFPAAPGRVVFVRVGEIRRVFFAPDECCGADHYYDNFGLFTDDPENISLNRPRSHRLSSLIIQFRRRQDLLVYHYLDPGDNQLELNEVNLWQPFYCERGFIQLTDATGGSNFIPIANITCMEANNAILNPANPWTDAED